MIGTGIGHRRGPGCVRVLQPRLAGWWGRCLGALRLGLGRFEAQLDQAADGFRAAADAQANDPLGVLKVSTERFGRVGTAIAGLGLPTVLVQEGGYLCDEIEANLLSFLTGFESAQKDAG